PLGAGFGDGFSLVSLGIALGAPLSHTRDAHVRADSAEQFANEPALGGITRVAFARPVNARNWLETSNPSERWKWDFMFQDLPPVKGGVDPSSVPMPIGAIPLKPV